MTIYGLSCRLGRSVKQRILGYQSESGHRDNLLPLFSDGESKATTIKIRSKEVIPFSIENRWLIEICVISG